MIDLTTLTISKAHEALSTGEYSVMDLCNAYLAVISEKNSDLNAYLEVYSDIAEQAQKAQEKFSNGTATLMTGIPVAVKDNILIEGKTVSAGSKILENYHATYDATVIAKLKAQGAVFLGRTNMDEFAMGSSTENSAFGTTKNPRNLAHVPGGTSGGSAAVVAANMALVALGSDTGGSIRQPAAFCGIVGMKPSYDSVSRSGLIADTSSFDQIGPLAKNVEDAEILWKAIVGKDVFDATTVEITTEPKIKSSTKLRIGVPKNFLSGEGINPELMENFNKIVSDLKEAGHEIIDVSIPKIDYALAVYYILQPAEVSSNLSRFDGIRYGVLSVDAKNLLELYTKSRGFLGKEARRRILLGTYVLSHGYYDAYYRKADALRCQIRDSFNSLLNPENGSVDVIITPTTPTPAFKIGEKISDPVSMYLEDIFTVPLNIASVPGISIPCGNSREGLPFGLQIISARYSDASLFTIAKNFEKNLLQ